MGEDRMTIGEFKGWAAEHLEEIRRRVPRHKLTLIARKPDDPDADIIVTSDILDEVVAAILRRKHQDA